jgi:hypothetical protein
MPFKTIEALAIALLGNQLSVDDLQAALKGFHPKQRLKLFEQLDQLQTPPEDQVAQGR